MVVTKTGYEVTAEGVFSDYSKCNLLSQSGAYGQWALRAVSKRIPEATLDLMKEGTYWLLKNVRLKYGREVNAGVDLDLYGARFTELFEDSPEPQLKPLLEYVPRSYLLAISLISKQAESGVS